MSVKFRFPAAGYRVSVLSVALLGFSGMQMSLGQQARSRPECNTNFGQCGVGLPCLINGGHQPNKLVFQFGGTSNETNKAFDFFNIRRDGNQDSTHNGYYVIDNPKLGVTYHIQVEGCVSHPLSHSDCSGWVDMSLATFPISPGKPPCPTTY